MVFDSEEIDIRKHVSIKQEAEQTGDIKDRWVYISIGHQQQTREITDMDNG